MEAMPATRCDKHSMKKTLNLADFSTLLGCSYESISKYVADRILEADFSYYEFDRKERDSVVLKVVSRIASGELTKVGEHRHKVWDEGWQENLHKFASEGFSLESLIPRFIHPEPVIRLRSNYVRANNPRFELFFHDVARRWLYENFMADASAIYEFGSGSAYNLVAIADMAPQVKLVGLDWAPSAVELANLIGQKRNLQLHGRRFDLFAPDESLHLGHSDAVLTVCALEQVGTRHEAFLQFLLRKKPQVCVHMEPLMDLYDPDNLVDYLAIQYHSARGYLRGFLPRLKELDTQGRIEIVAAHRMHFGSLFHEGYSYVVWRPL